MEKEPSENKMEVSKESKDVVTFIISGKSYTVSINKTFKSLEICADDFQLELRASGKNEVTLFSDDNIRCENASHKTVKITH